MKNREKALILSAISKPWEMSNGMKGISSKVRMMIAGEIFEVKATEDQVKALQLLVNETVTVDLRFVSPKEKLGVVLESFEE